MDLSMNHEKRFLDRIAAASSTSSSTSGQSPRSLEERLFAPVIFENGWSISAQADRAGYACSPRERLPYLEDYDALEVVVYAPDRDYVDPADLGLSGDLLNKFSPTCEDGPHVGANLTWSDVADLAEAVGAMPAPDTEMEP